MSNRTESNDVDWRICKTSIIERRKYLLENQKWTDCEFLVGNDHIETFRAHKLILSMASPEFEEMVYSPKATEKPIIIPDIEPAVFRALLKYIYFENFDVSDADFAFQLYYAASVYTIEDLATKCCHQIQTSMTPATACKSYELAKLLEEQTLKEFSVNMMTQRTNEVLAAPSINDIELETWYTLLDCDTLAINTELELLKSLYTWAKKECARRILDETKLNLRSVIEPVVGKIRFRSLNLLEFNDTPEVEELLWPEEFDAILLNISSTKTKRSMPPEFSENKRTCNSYTYSIYENNATRFQSRAKMWKLIFSVDRSVHITGIGLPEFDHLKWENAIEISLHNKDHSEVAKICKYEKSCEYADDKLFIPVLPFKVVPKKNYIITVNKITSVNLSVFKGEKKLSQTCEGVTFALTSGGAERIIKSIVFSLVN